jgi:predicted permease
MKKDRFGSASYRIKAVLRTFRFWLWLIRVVGVIVPRRLRANWLQEWEAELRHREEMLAQWDRLDWRSKLDLLWRSTSAFWDALWLQPKRFEDEMFQDLRFGVRMLLKRPGLILVAILCLALGTGANVLIFALVNAVVLRPVTGVHAPQELAVMLHRNDRNDFDPTSYPDYLDYRARNRSFEGLLAYRTLGLNLGGDGGTERIQGAIVSGNYFSVLGVGAAAGRTLRAEDDQAPGAHPVAVISHGLWQRRFAADPAVIGKTVNVNAYPFTIIGVAQADFNGTETGEIFDLWLPLAMQPQIMAQTEDRLRSRDKRWLIMIGRLKAGSQSEQAQNELDIIAAQLRQEYPQEHRGLAGIQVSPHVGLGPGDHPIVAGFLGKVLAVVGLVLLIACANAANLLLARAAARRKEVAIRLALGASRMRIIRQFLTESLLLAAMGATLGLLLPLYARDWLLSLFPPLAPESLNFNPDFRLVAFTLLLCLGAALLFGLAPALQASKPDVVPELKETAMMGGPRGWRLSGLLVAAQLALTTTLLIGAGLLVRTLQRLAAIDPGFDTESVLALSLDLRSQGYTEAKGRQFYQQLTERVAALPGVESASLASVMPLGWGSPEHAIFIAGQEPPAPDRQLRADYNVVTPDWFRTMGIPMVSGRDFTAQDKTDAPGVVIVNEAMARRFWPERDPLGQRFEVGEKQRRAVEIVGVARNSKHRMPHEEHRPVMYIPLSQQYEGQIILNLRSAVEPLGQVAAVRGVTRQLDPNLPLFEIKTMAQRAKESFWPTRTMSKLVGIFGAIALLLAGAGLYGVLSYTVSQRTREIGLRLALGAQAGDVLRLIIRQGLRLALGGVGLGLIAAFALTRVLAGFLHDVSATDTLTFAAIPPLLIVVALLACYLPARRATKVDPLIAIRRE